MLQSSRCFYLANLYSVLLTRFADLLFTEIFELDNTTEVSNMFCNRLDFEYCNFIFPACNFHESLAIIRFPKNCVLFLTDQIKLN